MAILTPVQILQYALNAGFKGTDAIKATAIAMAESGGNTTVVNSIGATGLWQIYPAQSGSTDPVQNAAQAYAKFLSLGWCAWSVTDEGNANGTPCPGHGLVDANGNPQRNNSYTNFMGVAQAAWNALNNLSPGSPPPSGGSSSPPPTSSGSTPPSSGGGFGTDVLSGFVGEVSGPIVLSVGLGLVVLGFMLWKGGDTVRVINQGIATSKVPARAAAVFA